VGFHCPPLNPLPHCGRGDGSEPSHFVGGVFVDELSHIAGGEIGVDPPTPWEGKCGGTSSTPWKGSSWMDFPQSGRGVCAWTFYIVREEYVSGLLHFFEKKD